MARFYDTLVKRRDCPPDCRTCEEACAAKLGSVGAVIKAENVHQVARSRNITCYQVNIACWWQYPAARIRSACSIS